MPYLPSPPFFPEDPGSTSPNPRSASMESLVISQTRIKNDPGERVTIWHRAEKRKIAGNAAPLRKNLNRYLQLNLDLEIYVGQDRSDIDPEKYSRRTGRRIEPNNCRVDVWNRITKRRISGRASPSRKNLLAYLARNPDLEVYVGQDKEVKPRYREEASNPFHIAARTSNATYRPELSTKW